MERTARSAVWVRAILAALRSERAASPKPRRSGPKSWRRSGHATTPLWGLGEGGLRLLDPAGELGGAAGDRAAGVADEQLAAHGGFFRPQPVVADFGGDFAAQDALHLALAHHRVGA